ncbi:MAG: glycosyltransferase family 2 protein [Myxococcales bacterium]|nr:MAG: glycosyltransferase family 2 protein [Myxococcales bacterium]
MTSQDLEISVVIPVYRSKTMLAELHERLSLALEKLGLSYEIVFVDDNSSDGSWEELVALADKDSHIRLVQLTKNFGQQRAVLCGLRYSRGRFVVTLDDDLQQRPSEIALLYEAIKHSDADVVVGRYEKKKHGPIRALGTWLVKRVAQLTIGIPKELELTSFRIIRRQIVDEVVKLRSTNPIVGFLLFHITHRISNITVSHDPRRNGKSSYSLKGLIDYFLCMVIDYSDLPLRFVGWVGFLSWISSIGLALNYLRLYLLNRIGVSGFMTQVLLLLFFSGVILMTLGIIGSYLIRILRASNQMEMYIVRRER